jgi:serine/threonine protein kinase
MPSGSLHELTSRDCELLNHSVIPYEELRFLHPASTESSPKFLGSNDEPIPAYSKPGCSIYPAVFNRLPVMVKEVDLDERLLKYFTPDRKFSLSQFRQLREIIVGLTLPRHGNLCQVLAWTRPPKRNKMMIVTERFEDDLDRYLGGLWLQKKSLGTPENPTTFNPEEGGILGWEQFFLVATELASALERLSKLNCGWSDTPTLRFREDYVVHRDLKLANLFLVFDGKKPDPDSKSQLPKIKTVALGDFGSARIEDREEIPQIVTTNIGTLTYQAPEAIDPSKFAPEERLTSKLDIFSYGVILWRLLHYPTKLEDAFKKVYEGTYNTNFPFQEAIVEGKVELPIDRTVPDDLSQILLMCCRFQPSSRPTAAEVRQALLATTKGREYFKCSDVVRTVTNASSGTLTPLPGAKAPKQDIEPQTKNLLTPAEQEAAGERDAVAAPPGVTVAIDPSSVKWLGA